MKLLICTQIIDKNDPILGFFHRWVEEFAKYFEHIYVICLKEGQHTLPQNVTVYSLGKEGGENNIKYLFRFYKYFSNVFFIVRIDFVFFHMGAIYNILAFPFFLFRRLKRTKFLWWKTHGLLNIVGKIALWGVDEVVTAGSKSFNSQAKKIRVVGHAIDTNAFSRSVRTGEESELKLLMVGRITPIKKIEIALKTIFYLRKDMDFSVSLDIYGPVTDLLYKEKLVAIINKYQLTPFVVFHGGRTQEQMRDIYWQYDVLIHPSYEAGFDKVILEAMAAGVVPVTSISSFEPILSPYGLYVEANNIEKYKSVCNVIQKMVAAERLSLQKTLYEIVAHSHDIATLPERIFKVI